MPCIHKDTCRQNGVCSPLQKWCGSLCSGSIREIENCTKIPKNIGRW